MKQGLSLDDPGREAELREKILGKPGLRDWYMGIYNDWAALLGSEAGEGLAVELGAGAGFSNAVIPGLLRTDTLAYPGVDQVADALTMPWKDGEVRAIFMLNVMHHLPDAPRFLGEAQRVLRPGGLLVITDPHIGVLSRWPYRWHHEPMDTETPQWSAPVEHALAGANSALTWIIFVRDRARFEREFPGLKVVEYRRFSPLQYWLSGGLKRWTLLPAFALPLARALDRLMLRLWPDTASFCHVVLRKASA